MYHRGELCIVEWKATSRETRVLSTRSAYDAPLQLAAYAGAWNALAAPTYTASQGAAAAPAQAVEFMLGLLANSHRARSDAQRRTSLSHSPTHLTRTLATFSTGPSMLTFFWYFEYTVSENKFYSRQ